MILNNPFGKKTQVKNENGHNQIKKDSTRENVKKTLINALEQKNDENNFKLTSEKIAIEIEEEIFEQNDNNAKNKGYRDKIKKIEFRIKGNKNSFIREILKNGLIDIKTFCQLDEQTLNDDNYFKKIYGVNINENNKKVEKKNLVPQWKANKMNKPNFNNNNFGNSKKENK